MTDKEKILKTLSTLLETGILTVNDIKKDLLNAIVNNIIYRSINGEKKHENNGNGTNFFLISSYLHFHLNLFRENLVQTVTTSITGFRP